LQGIPVTLDVPHHYNINIIEIFYEKNGNLIRDSITKLPVTSMDVEFEVVDTKEIFTVDFVKPGAGNLTTKLKMENQYFTSIENKIEDDTIEQITRSINELGKALKPATKGTRASLAGDLDSGDLPIQHRKVVANLIVEVSDPLAKEKIHEFLGKHLNVCTDCTTRPGTKLPPVVVVP